MAVVLAVLLMAPSAAANGRFPRAQQLILDPIDPAHLVLRTTFGIVTSRDGGAAWSWICESAVGYGGEEDPAIAVAATGAVLAGHFTGLSRSPDRGCSWAVAGDGLAERNVIDLTVERADPSHVTVLAATRLDGGPPVMELHASTDSGASWAKIDSDLASDIDALTLDRAPSEPARLYLSALAFDDRGNSHGELLRSEDDGATFTRLPIPDTSLARAPYIAAVDPNDSNVVWIRLAASEEGVLLLSKDGGTTFQEVLRAPAELRGFALSADGKTVFAGFGGGGDAAERGIWRADTDALVFEQVYHEPVSCLTLAPSGLYACTGQAVAGFEVGRSHDGGTTFERVLDLDGLTGPLECSVGTTVADVCGSEWPLVCLRVGRCGPPESEAPIASEPDQADASQTAGASCRASTPDSNPHGPGLLLAAVAMLALARCARKR